MSTFRKGFLYARSQSFSAVPRGAFAKHYGLGFFCTSWDQRSLASTALTDMNIDASIILRSSRAQSATSERTNFEVLSRFLEGTGSRIVEIDCDILDLEPSWSSILKAALGSRSTLAKGAFVDLSVAPVYYSIGLVNALLLSGAASFIDILYAEAEYIKNNNGDAGESFPFSFGQWKSVPIPFLEGSPQPSMTSHFFVSAGFEGVKTMRVLSKTDPDLITLILPIPGFRPEYELEVLSQNQTLIDNYSIPNSQILQVQAGDAVATWKALSQLTTDSPAKDVYYLCCGTKPHSLGLALNGLSTGYPCVLYNLPERLNETDIRQSGHFWKFELRDLTSGFGKRHIL
jgi:hypothetical protein